MKAIFLFIALLVCVTLAYADTQSERSSEFIQKAQAEMIKRFTKADANGDGMLTKDEANGNMPKVYKNFDVIDTEKKGYVTIEQIKSYAVQQLAVRRGEGS
ncbi:calcium-binding protein [Ampullimonas aquatilis]|uniref:calcium-binding protein n=1 Tax=Ampullimonas aquatilis TaxID=1341549 RepID=UPI003C775FED